MASSRWWTKDTLAVVTGANKGIGFEIAKQLAVNGVSVVLTARDQQRGLQALAKLKESTPSLSSNVVFHPLDVCSSESISNFASWLTAQFKGVDILVNNAAIAGQDSDYEDVSYERARLVLDTNYAAVKRLTNALLPCMKASDAGARIVNVSSSRGQLKRLSLSLQQEMEDPESLSEEKVDAFANHFLQDVREGDVSTKGWPAIYTTYSVSKVLLNGYTRILAKSLQNQPPGHKIFVNCTYPGYCKTDLTNNQGLFSPAEGADTAVWLALLPAPLPTGEFFKQRKPDSY